MQSLLIIDDDTELCALLQDYLSSEGFRVEARRTAAEGLEAALAEPWGLVILDLMLPDMNGFDVLARIRSASQELPVLILSAREEDVDRVVGLEMGADDYQTKPFHARELLARIRSILRRCSLPKRPGARSRVVCAGDLLVDRGSRAACLDGRELPLTQAEFSMLLLLLDAEGEVVSREDISLHSLGRELSPFDRSIDVHMSNLRRKLGPHKGGNKRILTVRGAGYAYLAAGQSEPDTPEDTP